MLTRRAWIGSSVLAAAGCGRDKPESGWPAAWDRILIEKAASTEAPRFDEKEALVTRLFGPGYRYHTKLREGRVHDLRASADYALALLELGAKTGLVRAEQILNRVCALQDTDPVSKWYGLWGYYLEEPPAQMAEADWNWADFLGGTLLLVDIRHGDRLEAGLRGRIRDSIHYAVLSVQRRDVTTNYTNIAVKGTFVCAAAAERLGLADLPEYARQRMARIEAYIGESGSFAEYNSPVYAEVTLTDLTRMRMYLRPGPVRDGAARIEGLLWLHLARHWDGFRKQFAGPMSRCYETDLGEPFWLEKSLGGRLGLANPALRGQYGDLDTAIHDFRCPEQLAGAFLQSSSYFRREAFLAPQAGRVAGTSCRPVQGATFVGRDFSLGSVNQGDFWVQRRPLLAYFGGPERPARIVRLRMIKDGYDFASGLVWTVQQDGNLLGLVNFRSPGGDRHPTLDPIRNGEFPCGRLFLELTFEGLAEGFSFRKEGDTGSIGGGDIHAAFQLRGGRFQSRSLQLEGSSTSRTATYTVDFKPPEPAGPVRWANTGEAWAVFTLALSGQPLDPSAWPCHIDEAPGRLHARWDTPSCSLEVSGLSRVVTIEAHQSSFGEKINSQDIPPVRLEESKP
jgi:hypothetical protein